VDLPRLAEERRNGAGAEALVERPGFAARVATPPEPPSQIVRDVLYEYGLHMLGGKPGRGKTTFAVHMALEAIRSGRHVIWVDLDMGENPLARKFADMGADQVEGFAGRIHYFGTETRLLPTPSMHARIADLAAKYPGALWVVDTVGQGLAGAALDEQSPGDVLQWFALWKELSQRLPVLLLDHIAWSGEGGDRVGRGTGAKEGDIVVGLQLAVVTPFNRDQIGVVRVDLVKDREGQLPLKLHFNVGNFPDDDDDERGILRVVPTEAPNRGVGGSVEERIIEYLREQRGGKVTRTQVVRGVKGDDREIRLALNKLETSAHAVARHESAGRTTIYWASEPAL
jgi:hypothetical protein